MSNSSIVKSVEFIGSFDYLNQCPAPAIPEFAFIGRSNVGKSSLINAITGRKSIARVSKSPGKTQNMNYYLINKSWYLVDLPGYGYAKKSKKKRSEWESMLIQYVQKRSNLITLFVLMDSRIGPQKIDMDFLLELGDLKVPFNIVYTKIDKVKPSKRVKAVKEIQNEIKKNWHELPEQFITSAEQKIGIDKLIEFINSF